MFDSFGQRFHLPERGTEVDERVFPIVHHVCRFNLVPGACFFLAAVTVLVTRIITSDIKMSVLPPITDFPMIIRGLRP